MMVMPRLHTSALQSCPFSMMTSGAIQNGEPTIVFRFASVPVSCPETPKSASFPSPLFVSRMSVRGGGPRVSRVGCAVCGTRTSGLQVSVNHVLGVQVMERVESVLHDQGNLILSEATAAHGYEVANRAATAILHHNLRCLSGERRVTPYVELVVLLLHI